MENVGVTTWTARAAKLVQWFQYQQREFPTTPFRLNAWTYVSDPPTFYAALLRDLAQGAQSPYAPSFVSKLEDLFAWWDLQKGGDGERAGSGELHNAVDHVREGSG